METTIANETPQAPTYSDAPDEATMRAQIQQMLAEMDSIRERMRRQQIEIMKRQAHIDAVLAEIKAA